MNRDSSSASMTRAKLANGCVDSPQTFVEYTHGALTSSDGTVRFRLWAPDVDQVILELDGEAPAPMQRLAEGYHERVCACAPGTKYRYRVSADLVVPDPASRLQDGDVHDASVVHDTNAYSWRHADWRGRPWTDCVFYEIHCGLAGGFAGVEKSLPDLAALGITAIELMPIGDFPGPRNWGYDGVLPYAPDTAYGTPEDLKRLIDTAHGLGLMVFLDVVYNHFGPDGNYLASYAAGFFRNDLSTPWGGAIDFRQPAVRRFFAENALYWLREYRFDGLRLDAVHAIEGRDWLVEMAAFVRANVDSDRQVHLVLENDDNAASLLEEGFDAQWNDDAHHVIHHILTGESQGYYAAYAEDITGKLARFLGEGFVYQGEPSSTREGRPRGEPSAALSPTSFVFFLQNHDQTGNRALGERLISLCGHESAALHAAVALQILTPHIPLFFMGEPCGATAPFQYFTSYDDPVLAQAVRDGRRKEFASFAMFADAADKAQIPDPNALETFMASDPTAQHDELQAHHWRRFYAELLAIRQQFITPRLLGVRTTGAFVLGPLAIRAQWVLGDGVLLTLYCNLGDQAQACPQPITGQEEPLFCSVPQAWENICSGMLDAHCTVATLSQPASREEAA